MNYLFIINDAPYGNERPYNALRLALNLAKRPEVSLRVFLMGDGVQCAVPRQVTPEGYYNIERMLKSHHPARPGRHLRHLRPGSRARARRSGRRSASRVAGPAWGVDGRFRSHSGVLGRIRKVAMKSEELRSIQAPLKARYKEQPGAAMVTLKASGNLGEGITCNIQTGKALVEAGLHPATGGDGLSLCSGDMLLEALVACAGVTLNAVATAIGVEIRHGAVQVEGDLDFRGTLGVAKDVPVGFQRIRLRFDLDTAATEEQLATLLRLTERYCVVLQTLRQSPEIEISRNVMDSSASQAE